MEELLNLVIPNKTSADLDMDPCKVSIDMVYILIMNTLSIKVREAAKNIFLMTAALRMEVKVRAIKETFKTFSSDGQSSDCH